MKSAHFKQVHVSLSQVCAFKATEAEMIAVTNSLFENGYQIVYGEGKINDGHVAVPIGVKYLLCTYKSNAYGLGVGCLQFVGGISQDRSDTKIAQIISSFVDKKIKSTSQYIGKHGIAVEMAVYEKGESIFYANSDEIFDQHKD